MCRENWTGRESPGRKSTINYRYGHDKQIRGTLELHTSHTGMMRAWYLTLKKKSTSTLWSHFSLHLWRNNWRFNIREIKRIKDNKREISQPNIVRHGNKSMEDLYCFLNNWKQCCHHVTIMVMYHELLAAHVWSFYMMLKYQDNYCNHRIIELLSPKIVGLFPILYCMSLHTFNHLL